MTSDSEPIRENNKTPDAHGESDAQASERDPNISRTPSVPASPPAKAHCEITCKPKKDKWDKFKDIVELVGVVLLAIYTGYTIKMYCANKEAANAAQSAANTAKQALEIANRPWVRIYHRVTQPLTFNVTGVGAGPTAEIVFEETLENVGPSVALNVLEWEQLVPLDSNGGVKSAETLQKERCDSNRHPQSRLADFTLFPHDPRTDEDAVGLMMSKVKDAAAHSMLKGKVGFVLVGCVYYRTPLEPLDSPRHETTFFYFLDSQMGVGMYMPYVSPDGVANQLRLNLATESAD